MNIRVAKESGFCYGVEGALEIVEKAVDGTSGPVHTYGPLMHNPMVVEDLEKKGVSVVSDPSEVDDGTVVIRAHGVPTSVVRDLEARGVTVLDGTCPFVLKTHRLASRLEDEGRRIVVIGDPKHPEVIGVVGHLKSSDAIVVNGVEEALALPRLGKVGVVVQSTKIPEQVERVVEALLARSDDVKVCRTLCGVVTRAQDDARALAAEVEVMIVIGGETSSNTKKLVEICRERCPRVVHVERPEEIDAAYFRQFTEVGVTAGTSTPKSIIEDVVERLRTVV